jgi:hypothetical protein
VNKIAFTPLQLRAARELLHWSREILVARMHIGFTDIARFENEGLFSYPSTLAKREKSSKPPR